MLLHFLVAIEKGETHMKTESTTLARQRETKCREEKKSRDRPWNFFNVFYCSSNAHFLVGSILTGSCLGVRPFFWSSPQNRGHNFQLSLHHRVWCSTDCLYFIMSSRQLTLFLFSIPPPTLNGFPVWVSFSQSELVTNLLLIHFYLTQAALILLPFEHANLSLKLWCSL